MSEGICEQWILSSQPQIVVVQNNYQIWILCCQIVEKFVQECFISLCLVKIRDVQGVDVLNFIEVWRKQVHHQETVTLHLTDQQQQQQQ